MTGTRRIAILGSNSFSGSDFIDLLLEDDNNEVLGISRSPEPHDLYLPYRRHAPDHFTFKQLDMNTEMPAVLKALDVFRPEYIVNFAALVEVATSWDYPEHYFDTNTVALSRFINHMYKQDYLKRYLHVSTPEVYGNCEGIVTEDQPVNPSTPYAASKAAADMLVTTYQRQFGFPAMTVRSTNIFGAHQQLFRIAPRSVIYIKNGTTIQLHGGGRAVKSYIHIRDISRGELAILEKGRIGECYHLSPDAGIAVRDVVAAIANRMGKRLDEVSEDVDERPGQDAAYVINSDKARQELGWRPTISFEDGLNEVVDWVESNWDEVQQQPQDYYHKG